MAKEIERKFLVVNDSYKMLSTCKFSIVQGYISTDKKAVVRVRIKDQAAFLTIKGENSGPVRDEWEYEIPLADAKDMMERLTSGTLIDKTRYIVDYKGFRWEIDEFTAPVDGLVVAEIELPSADTDFPLPPFIGREVTGDPAYYNSSLTTGAIPDA